AVQALRARSLRAAWRATGPGARLARELRRRPLSLLPRRDQRARDLRRRPLHARHGERCGSRGRRRQARARLQLRLQPVLLVRAELGLPARSAGEPAGRRRGGGRATPLVNDLEALRNEISELDRRLLELLNRRLELVASVRDYKDSAGERWIDPEREAELLQVLVAANPGPLSERGVTSIFSAVLDVLKQEVAADRSAPASPEKAAERPRAVERLAVVGTGLIGTSVALAAGQARGFDADAGVLERAAARGAIEPAASLAEVVAGAELVVVAVPVGAAPAVVQEVLDAAGPDTVVTDVASTKRPLALLEDPRFVPGHPVAGGATGGPARAAADLFDAATWFLTPTEASSGA